MTMLRVILNTGLARALCVAALTTTSAALFTGCNESSPSAAGGASSHPINSEGGKLEALARASAPYVGQSTPGSSSYKIGPLDVLDINVTKVPDLTQNVQVHENGVINLPLVGDVQAAGQTPSALEAELRKRLDGSYVKNPSVRVFVKEYNSSRVTVDGEVKTPGVFPLKGSPTVLGAIALAGGLDKDTASSEITIFRTSPDGTHSAARVDLEAIRTGAVADPPIQSGDVVVVGASSAKSVYNAIKLVVPFTSMGTLAFMAM